MASDPLDHPDLARIGRRLRDQLEEVLDADQHAARAALQRRRSLRDRFLEAEDRSEVVVLSAADGQTYRGTVTAVGVDHVVLDAGEIQLFVSIDHVVRAEFR